MPTPWTPSRIAAYRLIRCIEIGSKTLRNIFASRHDDLEAFLEQRGSWKEYGLSESQRHALTASLESNIEIECEVMDREGIRLLLMTDDVFPESLQHIPDPPAALFLRGADLREGLRIAIVGTRKMTPYGKQSAAYFAECCSSAGIEIVSGLAFGIDAAAHRSALQTNHPTIAVLPCGIDDQSIMPQSHLRLANEILEQGGTLISEHAPRTPALPYLYLHRNRIIAGLSDLTLVIEADKASGALTTAKLALEQGKDVLAVPGPIWSDVSRGTNQLIKDGATPCTCADDIFSLLGAKKPLDATVMAETRNAIPTNDAERRIIEALAEPTAADDLVRSLRIPAHELNALLSILEMKGYVVQVEGGLYGLKMGVKRMKSEELRAKNEG